MVRYFIDRPIAVTMVLVAILVLGVVSIGHLPLSLIPDVNIPYITVQAEAPDMSARELDVSVVRPLRSQFQQIDGVAGITCESKDGSARIRLSFPHSDDIDYRYIEVNEKLDRTMGSLPEISRPKVLKARATDIPVFYVNITGSGDFLELSHFAQDIIVRRIEQLDEVAMVDVSGLEEPEILILPDEERLQGAGIGVAEMEALVSSADIRLGSLTIRDGQYRYGVRFQSNAANADDIRNLWLNHNGKLLKLGDIASVEVVPAPRSGMLTYDGKPSLSLAVIKQSDARMADLRRAMDSLLGAFKSDYPGVEFSIIRDQTLLLDYSINSLILNIIIGILLACAVIFLFMKDFRSPMLVALTIPFSLVFSMLLFRILGMSLNIISLSGLLLGVGMMTDNTLILVDNITGRWLRGEPLRESVVKGTGEVAGPMLSSILTTCAVFIPLVSVNGVAGVLFRDQALAIAIVLFASWTVTMTAVPVYYWCLYRRQETFKEGRWAARFAFVRTMERWELRWSRWMLSHRWVAWAIVVGSFLGGILLFILLPKSYLPEITQHDMMMRVDWNSSVSPQENLRRCTGLEEIAGAEETMTMAGVQQFVLDHDSDIGSGEALVYMNFRDQQELDRARGSLAEYMDRIWPGVPYAYEPSGNIFDMVFPDREASLVARLRPVSSDEIDLSSLRECMASIKKTLPGVDIASIPAKEQVLFVTDARQMALYGIGFPALMSSLRSALDSDRILNIVQGDHTVPVVLGYGKNDLSGLLDAVTVRGAEADIPLSHILRRTMTEDLKTIVSGPEGEFYPLGLDVPYREVEHTKSEVRRVVAGDGRFEVGFSGSWSMTSGMIRDLAVTAFLAIVLLFLILAAQFESVVQPVIILLEIVIDAFAALAVLFLCGESINLMSLIGLVVVTGIVINDSILKIDTVNRLRREGLGVEDAILEAGHRRLKAIVMTSLTTVLAVCPFLIRGNMGSDLQYPLSLVIIAGMTAGTLVSLFVVPALYDCLYRMKR